MQQDFLNLLTSHGYAIPRGARPDKIMRIAAPGDKAGKKSGWVIYHEFQDGISLGTFGSWRDGDKTVWCSRHESSFSSHERNLYNERVRVLREEYDRQVIEAHAEARGKAMAIWSSASPLASGTSSHPYMARKMVDACEGVRLSKGDLVIPVMVDDTLSSLQFIKPDGSKKFLTGGKIKSGWFYIGGTGPRVYIAEGYATGMSIHMATGASVYVAFNAGNLGEVVPVVKAKEQGKTLVIAADDDQFGPTNAGRDKATSAGIIHGIQVVFPKFESLDTKPVDFNDLHALEGLERVAAILEGKPKLYRKKPTPETGSLLFHPPGIIGRIVDYYNSTSGHPQPGFAVQTALALGSLVCARNFESSNMNRTSMFFMIVGKSTTGKEHSKEVIEAILRAADRDELIAGEGYTSQAAIVEALRVKPRHITIIDEFSKYMRASMNKMSNANLAEANAALMKIIGNPRAPLRPKEYSNRYMSEEKKKELSKPISAPAITLIGMSTPDDLFGTIDVGSIKDGFWNRFVICCSDAERAPRMMRDPVPVPEDVLDWIHMVDARRGNLADTNFFDEPVVRSLEFTTRAKEIYNEFQRYQVDKSNALDKFHLGDLVGRSSEMALRISMIIAMGRNPNATQIDHEDVMWAVEWVKYNMNILADKLKMSVSGSEFEARKLESLRSIRESGSYGVSIKELNTRKPFSKYTPKERAEVIKELLASGLIGEDVRTTGKPGQPPMVYVATEEE